MPLAQWLPARHPPARAACEAPRLPRSLPVTGPLSRPCLGPGPTRGEKKAVALGLGEESAQSHQPSTLRGVLGMCSLPATARPGPGRPSPHSCRLERGHLVKSGARPVLPDRKREHAKADCKHAQIYACAPGGATSWCASPPHAVTSIPSPCERREK